MTEEKPQPNPYDRYKVKTTLSGKPLEKIISPFWVSGFKEENPVIDEITVDGKIAISKCHVETQHVSPFDGKYHLSVSGALALIFQTAIVHGHVLSARDEKTTEILLTDFNITLTKMIMQTSDITVKLELYAHSIIEPTGRRQNPRSFFSSRFSICDDAWWGKIQGSAPFR
ncbi:MAG: hypothetical protein IPJ88_10615 [Myxococcales bacterium]|nr:MAG: hypothetical protein IPJ88_10615 [Myxococcales bacterium]